MKLRCRLNGAEYAFIGVPMVFEDGVVTEPFQTKNNKTLLETLKHRRYARLYDDVVKAYPDALQEPLGTFLLRSKRRGDDLYRRFLNKYGDDRYSEFKIVDQKILNKRGVYAYTIETDLKYIGRCRDSMRKRVNQGYGKIHPKNCYIDGQATNCHLNALITAEKERVRLWFCELGLAEIVPAEKALISEYRPPWNIQRG
jgi:hypothetical protein